MCKCNGDGFLLSGNGQTFSVIACPCRIYQNDLQAIAALTLEYTTSRRLLRTLEANVGGSVTFGEYEVTVKRIAQV